MAPRSSRNEFSANIFTKRLVFSVPVFASELSGLVRVGKLDLQKLRPMEPASDHSGLLPCGQAASFLMICRSCSNFDLLMILLLSFANLLYADLFSDVLNVLKAP